MDFRHLFEKINEVADLLYDEQTEQGIAEFKGLLQEIERAIGLIEDVEKQDLMHHGLIPALHALESKDNVLLADILTFEINRVLERYC